MIKILLHICSVWLALCLPLGLQAKVAGTSTVAELRQQAAKLQQLRKYDQAIVVLEEAMKLLEKQSPQDIRKIADVHWDLGTIYQQFGGGSLDDKTARHWGAAIALIEANMPDRGLGEARKIYADLLVSNLYQYDEALRQYRLSLEVANKNYGKNSVPVAELSLSTGFLYLRLQQYDKAEAEYKAALQAMDSLPTPTQKSKELKKRSILSLAQLFQEKGDLDGAARYFEHAQDLVLGDAKTVLDLDYGRAGFTIFQERNGQYDTALILHLRGIVMYEDWSLPYLNMSWLLRTMHRENHSIAKLGIARLLHKKYVLLEQRKRSQIIDPNADILKEYDEKLTTAYRSLAELLLQTGRAHEAERVIQALRRDVAMPALFQSESIISLSPDEARFFEKFRNLTARYRELISKALTTAPNVSLNTVATVSDRRAALKKADEEIGKALITLFAEWKDEPYQLHVTHSELTRQIRTGSIQIAQGEEVRWRSELAPEALIKHMSTLAKVRESKLWGAQLTKDELEAANAIENLHDQRWVELIRFWSNEYILKTFIAHLPEHERTRAHGTKIVVLPVDKVEAKTDVRSKTIIVSLGLVRNIYDFVSAAGWIKRNPELAPKFVHWFAEFSQRNHARRSFTDTRRFYNFLDFARSSVQNSVGIDYEIANDVNDVYHALAFVLAHEVRSGSACLNNIPRLLSGFWADC
jgi:tetratricopeptide (TPR) repeat protein